MDYRSIGPPSGRGLRLVGVHWIAGLISNQPEQRTFVYSVHPRDGCDTEYVSVVETPATFDTP